MKVLIALICFHLVGLQLESGVREMDQYVYLCTAMPAQAEPVLQVLKKAGILYSFMTDIGMELLVPADICWEAERLIKMDTSCDGCPISWASDPNPMTVESKPLGNLNSRSPGL